MCEAGGGEDCDDSSKERTVEPLTWAGEVKGPKWKHCIPDEGSQALPKQIVYKIRIHMTVNFFEIDFLYCIFKER